MPPKLVVIDVDDTLKPEGRPIPKASTVALCEALDRGITIAIASGRPPESVVVSLISGGMPEDLVRERVIIIGFNGAEGKQGKTLLYRVCIEPGIVDRLSALIRSLQPHVNVAFFTSSSWGMMSADFWAGYYQEKLGIGQPQIRDAIPPEPITKLVIMSTAGDSDLAALIDTKLAEMSFFPPGVHTFRAKTQFVEKKTPCEWTEVMAAGVHKGRAVVELASLFAIQLPEVMCIGDGINDLEMLKMPEVLSVVVDNCRYPEVRALANYVANCVDASPPGVAQAIHKFCLG